MFIRNSALCYNRYYFIFQCSEHKVYCGRLFVCGQKYVSNFNHSCTYCQVSFPNVFNHFLIFLCISKFSNFYTYCIFLNELLNNYKVVKTCLCKSLQLYNQADNDSGKSCIAFTRVVIGLRKREVM